MFKSSFVKVLFLFFQFQLIFCEIGYEQFVDKALNGTDVCSQPSLTGPCRASFPRFYYNTTVKQCQKFTYGGCDGNDNNFLTLDECQRVCVNKTECKMVKLDPILKPGCRYDLSLDKFGCPKNKIVCDVRPGRCPILVKTNSTSTSDDEDKETCTIQCAHSDQECQQPKKCCKIGCNHICVAAS